MAWANTTIAVSAVLFPKLWANVMQIPLRKSLVSVAIADTQFEPLLKYGDRVTQPYMEDATVQTYTPGASFSAQGASAKEDTLIVDQFKVSPNYVDDVNLLQSKYSYSLDLIESQAYKLKDTIDDKVFETAATAAELYVAAFSAAAIAHGTASAFGTYLRCLASGAYISLHAKDTVTAAMSPIDLFAHIRNKLRAKNVEEAGDWVAVIDPSVAQVIEQIGAEKGFNVADSTLRNGYAGNFMGFKIYISNNLHATAQGSLGSAAFCYFGRSKRVGLAIQMPPKVQVKDYPTRLGSIIVSSVVYGTKVFTKNKSRYLIAVVKARA